MQESVSGWEFGRAWPGGDLTKTESQVGVVGAGLCKLGGNAVRELVEGLCWGGESSGAAGGAERPSDGRRPAPAVVAEDDDVRAQAAEMSAAFCALMHCDGRRVLFACRTKNFYIMRILANSSISNKELFKGLGKISQE